MKIPAGFWTDRLMSTRQYEVCCAMLQWLRLQYWRHELASDIYMALSLVQSDNIIVSVQSCSVNILIAISDRNGICITTCAEERF